MSHPDTLGCYWLVTEGQNLGLPRRRFVTLVVVDRGVMLVR
jgi:hypothetical protein